MVRTFVAAVALVVLTTLTGVAAGQGQAQPDQLRRAMYSRAVEGKLELAVYLPTGYAGDRKRYPVVGRGDSRFRAENRLFDRELTAARVPHLFRLYPGGHEQAVWTAHAKAWLAVAVDHLAKPR
jgi:enterochelin esterase-like enzyme